MSKQVVLVESGDHKPINCREKLAKNSTFDLANHSDSSTVHLLFVSLFDGPLFFSSHFSLFASK